MTHEEFLRLHNAGKITAGVSNSVAIRLIDYLPRRYQLAHHFWSWVWMLLIPAFIAVAIFVKWWVGLLLLCVVTPLIFSAVKRSAAQFVLEHATENADFFNFLIAKDLLVFRATD